MGRRTTLFAHLQVVPFTAKNEQGEEEEAKQFIFTDAEGGEVIIFPMGKRLADEVARKMKMSNKSLAASLEEEHRRMQARATVAGANGDPVPGEDQIVREIMKGVRREEEDK